MTKFKKRNLFIFSFLLIIFSFSIASSVLALEAKYPPITGLPVITNSSTIGDYIGYFFGLAISIAGAVAVISLVFSGIQLMIGTINPESATNAKDRIKGSVLGLVLLMVSFLIMKTINPVLTTPSLNPLPPLPGILYTNGTKDIPSSGSESNTANIPAGFIGLKYTCNPATAATTPNLLVWLYPETDFKGDTTGATTKEIACNGAPLPLSSWKSFTTTLKTPGVYFYLTTDCTGLSSTVRNSSGMIDFIVVDPTSKKSLPIKSAKIVNDVISDPVNKNYYGIIAHETNDFNDVGMCQEPFLVQGPGGCQKFDITPMSANIFIWNKASVTGKSSGDGVTFYNNPFGWKTGARAGEFYVGENDIDPAYVVDPLDMPFDYSFADISPGEEELCPTFADCQGSIEISGNYLVALYSENTTNNCQVFTENVENLLADKSIKNIFGKPIKTIAVIATK